MAHCGLPLHPSVRSTALNELLSCLLYSSDAIDELPLGECYHLLRSLLAIEVEALGDPVISLRKLLDMQHPCLSGGILQTTLMRKALLKQDDANSRIDTISQIDNHIICSKQLKPTRMPNPLPIPTKTSIRDLFLTRILSDESIKGYNWTSSASFDTKSVDVVTIRKRTINELPDIFMAHLQHLVPGQDQGEDISVTDVPLRVELSTMCDVYFELIGAILHIKNGPTAVTGSCGSEEDVEEGGHTAALIQWTPCKEKTVSCSWYLIDDEEVFHLESTETKALLEGCPYNEYTSEPHTDQAFAHAVLLVYRKS